MTVSQLIETPIDSFRHQEVHHEETHPGSLLGLIVLIVGVVAACGSGGSKEIRPSDYASTGWTLTVESAELHCKQFRFAEIGEKPVMWVEHDGKHYTVSTLARSYLKIQGIPHDEIYNIDSLVKSLCRSN